MSDDNNIEQLNVTEELQQTLAKHKKLFLNEINAWEILLGRGGIRDFIQKTDPQFLAVLKNHGFEV